MPSPRDPQSGARPFPGHLDNPRWQDNGNHGPFRGHPRQIRNGVPWKPYPGTLHLLPRIREIEREDPP